MTWLQLSSVSELHGGEGSILGRGSFSYRGTKSRILSVGDWVEHRKWLEVLERKKILSPAWIWTADYRVCSLVTTATALSRVHCIIKDNNEMCERVKSVWFRRGTGGRLTRTWYCTFGEVPEYHEGYYLVRRAFAVRLLSFASKIREWIFVLIDILRGRTIKFANSPPFACRGSTGQKPSSALMTLTYQSFTAVFLLIYGSLFLSGFYYCLRVFWCAAARMSELELQQRRF